ncbi:MAG: EamA family transporter [Alistipes sp.]|nr:EamA family transporter [Candidatus Alistipes equi]
MAGYFCGIVGGATYGMNPLFAKPLISNGVSVPTMLFFRYFLAALLMAVLIRFRHESRRVKRTQIPVLILLGILYATSSILLFESYQYIPSGLATTLIYLYPIFSVLILIFVKEYPSWQTLFAIMLSLIGVALMTLPSSEKAFPLLGIMLTLFSALCYAFYLVVIHLSRKASSLTADIITYYGLVIGTVMFFFYHLIKGGDFFCGVLAPSSIWNFIGLAIFPTVIAMFSLTYSTRVIGATKTGVLGVFEPLTAILIGVLLFRESLSWNVSLGISLSIIAVLVMIISQHCSSKIKKIH